MTDSRPSLSYRDAGVDIDAGNALVERIKPHAKSTLRPEVMGGLGGFGSLFRLPAGYEKPVLVAGTDGVGTKLRLAMDQGRHDGIGIDLVAMCVNDLIVGGAEPLFFLDYYATGALDVDTAATVVASIAEGCRQSGCALVGGETAEMPGMYEGSDYDLAGFCVGIVDEDKIIDGSKVRAGDTLIALASSGPHSNGYSLIRRILAQSATDGVTVDGKPLAEALLAPTRIYVKSVLALLKQVDVHALAHITGGGFQENLPRVIPGHLHARIDTASWTRPEVFRWLQDNGNVSDFEMLRTFNCGAGMIIAVDAATTDDVLAQLAAAGEQAWVIGDIAEGDGPVDLAGLAP